MLAGTFVMPRERLQDRLRAAARDEATSGAVFHRARLLHDAADRLDELEAESQSSSFSPGDTSCHSGLGITGYLCPHHERCAGEGRCVYAAWPKVWP